MLHTGVLGMPYAIPHTYVSDITYIVGMLYALPNTDVTDFVRMPLPYL